MENQLFVTDRHAFREWLATHPDQKECWVALKRGRPTDGTCFWYIDAVEEALSYGWIDSTQKKIDGVIWQRFSPRKKSSPCTELNKERARRLRRLGLMTPQGLAVLPDLDAPFRMDPFVLSALKKARVYSKFCTFPPLYQRVRSYNVAFYRSRDPVSYERALERLLQATKEGKLYGEWNDYGRLTEE